MTIEYDGYYKKISIKTPEQKVPGVVCLFETKQFGIVQIRCSIFNDDVIMDTYDYGPNIEMFSDKDRRKMKIYSALVYRMIYDAPAMTERFE
jgi:hypothetical protein